VRIGVVGKYIELQDAYKSVYEAIIHGGIANDCGVEIQKVATVLRELHAAKFIPKEQYDLRLFSVFRRTVHENFFIFWTAINPKGHRHFKSFMFQAQTVKEGPGLDSDMADCARARSGHVLSRRIRSSSAMAAIRSG
jgi:hypothetical protein